MENNLDAILEFLLIRQSVVACAHLPSVEYVDHYLTVPGFCHKAKQRHIQAKYLPVLIQSLSEMDLFLMTGIVWLPAQVILCVVRERRETKEERERGETAANKGAVAEGYHRSSYLYFI